jgi:hypothetical protein
MSGVSEYPCPQPVGLEYGTVPIVGTKAERRAARERVSAYHQAQLTELLSHVAAAIDRYRAGEIDAYAVDETIHHYHRAAGNLWKFCFARGGGTHAEFIAGLLDRMTADAEPIDWWERATPRPDQCAQSVPLRSRSRRESRGHHGP